MTVTLSDFKDPLTCFKKDMVFPQQYCTYKYDDGFNELYRKPAGH